MCTMEAMNLLVERTWTSQTKVSLTGILEKERVTICTRILILKCRQMLTAGRMHSKFKDYRKDKNIG